MRVKGFRSLLLAGLLLARVVSGQQSALSIITHGDNIAGASCIPDQTDAGSSNWMGCCGSPGRRACDALPGCVGSTSLLIDPYSGQVSCELKKPACDPAMQALVRNNATIPGSRDFTFYATSDLHFFREAYTEAGQVYHVKVLNNFASTWANLLWPTGVGLPPSGITAPAAVIVNGDLTTYGHDAELGAYRLLWERGTNGDSIQYPVFVGLGNHDIKGTGNTSDSQRMLDYLQTTMSCGPSQDPGSLNYSWDWQGVHMVQLNTWADDQTATWPHTANGLQWLDNDLKTNVGHTGKPVMFFQHYGLSVIGNGNPGGNWWSVSDFTNFWNVIKKYNVIGLFSGHTHTLGLHRLKDADVDPGLSQEDTASYDPLLDNFEDGSGGDTGAASGKVGSFLATRVTDDYLDVAAVSWGVKGDVFTDSGINFLGGSAGCRKKINSRFIPVPTSMASVSPNGSTFVVKNLTTSTIPGPIAVRVYDPKANLNYPVNQDFVDSCSVGKGNAYYVVNNGLSLTPKQQVTRSTGISIGGAASTAAVYAIVPLVGTSPQSIDLTTTSGATPTASVVVPDPQTLTVYGPPNTGYKVAHSWNTAVTGWLQLNPASGGTFDSLGRATVTVSFVQSVLQGQPDGNLSDALTFTQTATNLEKTMYVSLHIRAPVTVSLSVNPAQGLQLPGNALFTATLDYDKTVIQPGSEGQTFRATGTVSLREVAMDTVTGKPAGSTTVLDRAVVNGNQDCSGLSWGDDTVVFGDIGGNGHYCPTPGSPINLPRGIHYLAAYYEGSGSGDNKFAPASSNIVQYEVFQPGVPDQVIAGGDKQFAMTKSAFASRLFVRVLVNGRPDPGHLVSFGINQPSFGSFAGGATQSAVFTDSQGIAASGVLTASAVAGTWTVSAKPKFATAPLTFTLTNVAPGGKPDILVTLTGKSGTLPLRTWEFTVSNPSQIPLVGLTISKLTLTQEAGTPCTPSIRAGIPFTKDALPPNEKTLIDVGLNFGTCAATARFLVSADITANGGTYSTTATIGHQFP